MVTYQSQGVWCQSYVASINQYLLITIVTDWDVSCIHRSYEFSKILLIIEIANYRNLCSESIIRVYGYL